MARSRSRSRAKPPHARLNTGTRQPRRADHLTLATLGFVSRFNKCFSLALNVILNRSASRIKS